MVVFLCIAISVLLILWILSRSKYAAVVQPLDKETYPLKLLLPIGLCLIELLQLKLMSGYSRKLLGKIAGVYGTEHVRENLRLHVANKMVYECLSILMVLLIGLGTKPDMVYTLFALSLLAGVFYFTDRELDKKLKKRRMAICRDFPDFLSKLVLLIHAGLTVSKAWEKASRDETKDSLLYKELNIVLGNIRSGIPEQQAYEDFARRCRVPEISRFVSVILQNLRKGNAELAPLLRIYAAECWDMRRSLARRLGEEASTRLLFPMMLMFAAVLMIVITPAILALRGI